MEKGVRRGERSKGMARSFFFSANNSIGICVIPHQYRYRAYLYSIAIIVLFHLLRRTLSVLCTAYSVQ